MSWIIKIGKLVAVMVLLLLLALGLLFRRDIPAEELQAKYLSPESQFIDVEGIRLHVRIMGEGEPVFLLHGSFSSLHTWDKWQQEMSPYYQTISLDFPGHGLTGPDSLKRYGIEDYSRLVHALAQKLELSDYHVAGNSMGGAVALQMASDRPDRVRSLNLIDAAGVPPAATNPADSLARKPSSGGAWIIRIATAPVLSTLLLSCTPRFLFALNMQQVYGDDEKVTDEVTTRYYELMLREGNRRATLDRLQQPRKNSIRFDRLTMPTLILWGVKDRWIPLSQGKRLQQLLPGSNLVVFDLAGHVPMEEIPTETVGEYLRFLGVEVRKNYLQPFNQVADAF